MEEPKTVVDTENPDVIAISEALSKSEVHDSACQSPGFLLSMANRLNRRGGKVILHAKVTLTVRWHISSSYTIM